MLKQKLAKIISFGKWLFILPFTMYVILHFGQPEIGASFVPSALPFPLFWNYFTGLCLIAFIVSALTGTLDKLAALLMALYVVLMIFLVHIPRAGTNENDLLNIFRNTMVTGALLMYAQAFARDKRLVG